MSYTILLVESDPTRGSALERPLAEAGWRIVVAHESLEALETFQNVQPDLVMIEARVPDTEGLQLCQVLKETPQGRSTPVIVASATEGNPSWRAHAVGRYGCDAWIEIPVADERLVEECAQLLVARQSAGNAPTEHEALEAARIDPTLDSRDVADVLGPLDAALGSLRRSPRSLQSDEHALRESLDELARVADEMLGQLPDVPAQTTPASPVEPAASEQWDSLAELVMVEQRRQQPATRPAAPVAVGGDRGEDIADHLDTLFEFGLPERPPEPTPLVRPREATSPDAEDTFLAVSPETSAPAEIVAEPVVSQIPVFDDPVAEAEEPLRPRPRPTFRFEPRDGDGNGDGGDDPRPSLVRQVPDFDVADQAPRLPAPPSRGWIVAVCVVLLAAACGGWLWYAKNAPGEPSAELAQVRPAVSEPAPIDTAPAEVVDELTAAAEVPPDGIDPGSTVGASTDVTPPAALDPSRATGAPSASAPPRIEVPGPATNRPAGESSSRAAVPPPPRTSPTRSDVTSTRPATGAAPSREGRSPGDERSVREGAGRIPDRSANDPDASEGSPAPVAAGSASEAASAEAAQVPPPAPPSMREPSAAASTQSAAEAATALRPLVIPGYQEPEVVQRVEPAYPPQAFKKGVGASVRLKVNVNERGKVVRVLVDPSPSGSDFESSAIDAVLRWSYRPASENGHPVRAWTVETFVFDPGSAAKR